jgi:LysR family transcriptional regulator, hydrogen peroxide-inducible genes activator
MPISSAPHPFTLRQLQYVLAVAEELSFHRAAERCHVSQPSLSAQVAELESCLGVRLFERDRRRVLVSNVGEQVLPALRRLLLAADELLAAARQGADPLSGALSIGVIPTVSPYLLPSITGALRAHFPRLTLNWIEDKTATLVKSLAEGRLDAAVVALEAELGPVEHELIAKDPFLLAAAPGHPLLAEPGPLPRRELSGTDVLLLDDGHCLREQALEFCSRAKARELEFRATSLPTLVQMVAGGAGVTLLPELAIPTEAPRAEIAVRRFADPAPERSIVLIWRRHSALTETLRAVAEVMRQAYPKPRGQKAANRPPRKATGRAASRKSASS